MKNLHLEFVQLGRERNKLTYKLLQLLPEIYASGIYKKYAPTIEEYAGRFAGLPKSLVKRRLNLEKHLENKPKLKQAIATQGLYKVALVAQIATSENDEFLADKVEHLSKSALQVLSKQIRRQENQEATLFNEITSGEVTMDDAVIAEDSVKLKISGELLFKFLRLKKKLGKLLSNKRFIQEMIEKSYQEEFGKEDAKVEAALQTHPKGEEKPENQTAIASQKEGEILPRARVAADEKKTQNNIWEETSQNQPTGVSRYIPIKLRRQALARTHNRCDYPNCNKPHDLFHHPDRFSRTKNHDHLAPLCKIHHSFAHNGLIENEQQKTTSWQLKTTTKPQLEADLIYRRYRQTALA